MIITAFDVFLFVIYFIVLYLSIFWLGVLFLVKEEEKPKKKGKRPMFTAIVPAYNEERAIVQTLKSLVALNYPKDKKQIIVVNDGSKDRTRELVESYIARNPGEPITLINQENQGKAVAMNKGLEIAKGEYFACLDADSFVAPNALIEMLPYFEDEEVAAVCPLLKVNKPSSVIEKVQWYEYVVNMFYKHLNGKLDCIHVTPGPFSVYRTGLIKDLGGYDTTTITEDLEIAIRLQKHQYKIVQTFDATVYTNSPKTWRSLFWQRVRWYRGSVDNSLRYKKIMFNKKYGDFGIIRMPTIIMSGILTILITGFLLREVVTRLTRNVVWLQAINFDIFTILKAYEWQVDLLNLPYSKYFIALTVITLGLFVMVYSYRLVGEKITNHGKTFASLSFYLLVYSFFLSFVWMYIAFQMVTKRKLRW